jgi:hypothetical protein
VVGRHEAGAGGDPFRVQLVRAAQQLHQLRLPPDACPVLLRQLLEVSLIDQQLVVDLVAVRRVGLDVQELLGVPAGRRHVRLGPALRAEQ